MIDLNTEAALTLNAARKLPELRRDGKRPDLATLYRWSSPRGCRGVRLETVQIGGSRCTTHEAVRRFIHALTDRHIAPPPASSKQTAESAVRELAASGF